jgi:hypothetical protein
MYIQAEVGCRCLHLGVLLLWFYIPEPWPQCSGCPPLISLILPAVVAIPSLPVLIKKKIKFSSYIRKSRRIGCKGINDYNALLMHMVKIFLHFLIYSICLCTRSHLNFPIYEENSCFLFHQCGVSTVVGIASAVVGVPAVASFSIHATVAFLRLLTSVYLWCPMVVDVLFL